MRIINVEDTEIQVDDEDYSYLVECYDFTMTGLYVRCAPKKKWKQMGLHSNFLHKILMNPDKTGKSINVDHRDGNENNYQKDNLRVCTHQENSRNRRSHITYGQVKATSEYKGVNWNKKHKRWQVLISVDVGSIEFVGYFTDEVAGANAYNHRAKELYGEFARLNDVPYMSPDECELYRPASKKTSKFRGVSKVDGKWLVQIYHNKKNIIVGNFEDEIEAALAYNTKATQLKGKKAKLNKL